MAPELILIVLAHSAVSLANILPIDYLKSMSICITKGYAETCLHLRKWLTMSTRLNQSMRLPLSCALRNLNSEADIATARWHPSFPVYPIKVSVRFLIAIKSLQMKTRILRKIIKQIKGFYSLTDCTHAQYRMTAFNIPVFCSMYKGNGNNYQTNKRFLFIIRLYTCSKM